MPSGLIPTSYAVLGLLAVKPWATYAGGSPPDTGDDAHSR